MAKNIYVGLIYPWKAMVMNEADLTLVANKTGLNWPDLDNVLCLIDFGFIPDNNGCGLCTSDYVES